VKVPLDAVQPAEASTASILGCLVEKLSLFLHSDIIILGNVERMVMNPKPSEVLNKRTLTQYSSAPPRPREGTMMRRFISLYHSYNRRYG